MTIEITDPEVEALIRRRMDLGSFKSPEDLIHMALRDSTPRDFDSRTGADLIAAMQACPFPEVELAPERLPSPIVRDVKL